MQNPIHKILDNRKPFTYFHTHVINREVLDRAVAAQRSLEVDLSIDESGEVFVGHPLVSYEFNKQPPPNNLPLDVILNEMKMANLYLVLDCKDAKALPKVQEIIQYYGPEKCLLHACVDALVFKPYPDKIKALVEPHWGDDELPFEELLEIKRATGVPLALYCRGLTEERLKAEGEQIIARMTEVAKGKAEVIVMGLPKGEIWPLSVMQRLLKHNILSLLNIDHTPYQRRPSIFLGTTDILERASIPRNF
jgi:hypothetical protein